MPKPSSKEKKSEQDTKSTTTSRKPRIKQSEVATIKRSQISLADYNPRDIAPINRELLGRCMKDYGLVTPLVFNTRTNTLVNGHQRIALMDQYNGAYDGDGNLTLDYDVSVSLVDLSEAEEMRLNIALNNQHLQGTWDAESLVGVLQSLADETPDGEDALARTGFDKANLAVTLMDMQVPIPSFITGEVEETDVLDFLEDDIDQNQIFVEGQKEVEIFDIEAKELTNRLKARSDDDPSLLDKIKLNKERFDKKQEFSQDSRTSVNLVFGTSEQAEALLYGLGIPDEEYIDALCLCKSLGFDLNKILADYRKDLLEFGELAKLEIAEVDLEKHSKTRLQPKKK